MISFEIILDCLLIVWYNVNVEKCVFINENLKRGKMYA